MQWSCHVIWDVLGSTFMAAQVGLKTQECQCNLSAIYIGRYKNSIGTNKPRSWNCGMKITDHRRTRYSTLTYFKQISMKSCWTFIVSDVKKPITSTGQSNLTLWESNYKVSFVIQLLSSQVFSWALWIFQPFLKNRSWKLK